MKATDKMERMDLRRHRAETLAVALMREVEDVLGDFDNREVFDRISQVLYRNGACWTTEEERLALGFEARDGLGWTASERVEEERRKLEAMQVVMAMKPIVTS